MIRQVLVLLVLAAAAYGGWLWLGQGSGPAAVERGPAARPIPIEVAAARSETITDTVEAVASTRSAQAVDVVPTVGGRIAQILFAPGQRVAAGDLLVTLDAKEEQAAVAEAEAMMADAKAQFDRAETLAKTRSVADARVDELRAAYLSAQARTDIARKRLADTEIRAPFAGVVGLREVSIGARVDDSTKITTLDAVETLEAEFSVPEQYYGRIQPGTAIRATASAYPDRVFEGVVGAVDSRIDPVARAFRVRADIPNGDLALTAGLFMVVEIVLGSHEAVVVPEQSVVLQGRTSYVYRIADGKAQRVEVTLGQRLRGVIEITQGLAVADTVAITGLQRLRDGSAVEIQPDPGAPAAAPVS
ncbi:MAG: efflux RND transporter periplasmic adaptor subunit [Geminicoccaceae bacterium]